MANSMARLVVPGRHTRRPGVAGLRRVCLATLIMLVLQYGLGIFLNLYVEVPASDAHAGIVQEIETAPLALTVHALLGLALIGTAIVLLARAVRVRDVAAIVLAAAGLAAIVAAFAAGEAFVRDGQSGTSFAMAILTGAALLCYVAALGRAGAARQAAARQQQQHQRHELRIPVTPVRAPAPVRSPARPQPSGSWFTRE
jgi:hypothetical protein